jgi:hypothetical protein
VRRVVGGLAMCAAIAACSAGPTDPRGGRLPLGRWTGDGACLSVIESECNLTVGCGHGQFPRPIVAADGTFGVDGTYRVEVGPISVNPGPPAYFSGFVSESSTITLRVVLTSAAAQPATYVLRPAASGGCPIPCV